MSAHGGATMQASGLPRVLAQLRASSPGPSLLLIGGLHGNEPAGVRAAQRVFDSMQDEQVAVRGEVLALAGNLRGLARGQRYIDTDLNRHWTPDAIDGPPEWRPALHEDVELQALKDCIEPFLARARGPVFVIDMHTTSNAGAPFATIGDTLRNRRFAAHFHSTVVLGLEEELQGTLLEYLSDRGCITMGFEAGQHDDPQSVDTHEAVIRTALAVTGILDPADLQADADPDVVLAGRCRHCPRFFEIQYRHAIRDEDAFRMAPGFTNFDTVREGQVMGEDHRGEVRAPRGGLILMPLYQGQGADGFFIGTAVRPFWLRLSAWVRRLRLERLMHWLPGVSPVPEDPDVLRVDTRVARWYPLEIFHLLGFRRRRPRGRTLYVSRRRHDL